MLGVFQSLVIQLYIYIYIYIYRERERERERERVDLFIEATIVSVVFSRSCSPQTRPVLLFTTRCSRQLFTRTHAIVKCLVVPNE